MEQNIAVVICFDVVETYNARKIRCLVISSRQLGVTVKILNVILRKGGSQDILNRGVK